MTHAQGAPARGGVNQLRHDLLNPINVLVGATSALARSGLDEKQERWVRMLQSTAVQLREIADRLESYGEHQDASGQERLADLCSIAAARIAKPIDRARLVSTIQRIVGTADARILVVDDSPELAVLVRTYLEGMGWRVDVVDTGERAVAQASSETYDVLLMDIDLPGLDGATAAHAIRTADLARGASPTPIVAMTAFDRDPAPDLDPPEPPAADIVRIDDPEIAPLVPDFLRNRRDDVAFFRAALETRAFGRIQSVAHKLKGSGRGYGFVEISRIGDALERAAHEQQAERVRQLVDELESYLARVTVT